MKTRPKLIALQALGNMFDLIWISALIALVYFLYGALANGMPWPYFGWLVAVGVIARQIAGALKDAKLRVDYIDQLTKRGYEREDAEAAWRISSCGGSNLLRNLQQSELGESFDRHE